MIVGQLESSFCQKCGKKLTHNEIGLHKKMINRGSKTFFCMDCLSEYLKMPREQLQDYIEYFRSQGCTLFV